MKHLHIDIETYSSVDIRSAGMYKYIESPDFEILMVAYAYDDDPVEIIDLCDFGSIHDQLEKDLRDPTVLKFAHNAAFERKAFERTGIKTPPDMWYCSAVNASKNGLPLSLDAVGKALGLSEEKVKMAEGKALIRYFCMPCKPTKTNGGRTRNMPEHDLVKWERFKKYCMRDVEAEREITKRIGYDKGAGTERQLYVLDQEINDKGVGIDMHFAQQAIRIDAEQSEILRKRFTQLTGVDNPNSGAQAREWIGEKLGRQVTSIAATEIPTLLENTDDKEVREVLRLRQRMSKTSTKKYNTMINCVCEDERARGLFQFYGAGRTGR